MSRKIRVTVWNEFRHEQKDAKVQEVYPKGIHQAIADFLGKEADIEVRTATLDEPENGLPQEVLDNTDVLFWWGHMAHGEVAEETVDRVQKRILSGMGLIVLHSGHKSKIFMRMLGTTADLRWREVGERERVWVVEPSHPIAAGLPEHFEIPPTEMYGERFDIPRPDDTVFITWYEGGDVFRSGVTFTRGSGRIFYFAPGHETFPIYYDPTVQKVLLNAARWCAARVTTPLGCRQVKELEEIKNKI